MKLTNWKTNAQNARAQRFFNRFFIGFAFVVLLTGAGSIVGLATPRVVQHKDKSSATSLKGNNSKKAINYNSSKSNTGNVTAGEPSSKQGSKSKKAINYNSSKSNTGNVTAGEPSSKQGSKSKKAINYNSSKSNTGSRTANRGSNKIKHRKAPKS